MADQDVEIPFVVCSQHGGPYDDESFGSGVLYGFINADMQRDAAVVVSHVVPTALVPQLDLLAMAYGLEMFTEPDDEPGWSLVTFQKGDPDG